MKTLLALSLLTVTLAGCQSSEQVLSTDIEQASVATDMNRTFELRPGQTARVGTGGLLIGFRGISQDSRCPVDVNCVWSGDATAHIQATVGRMAWTNLELHTHVEPRSGRFREFTITVVGLKPEPRSTERIARDRYVVTLRVE